MTDLEPEIVKAAEVFEIWYSELQTPFNVQMHSDTGLVSPVSNQQKPIHRWYSLKEGYSSDLPIWAVNYLSDRYGAKISRTIDPFIGGGTTGVSLVSHGIAVDGVEYNPFIHLVSRVKSQYPLLQKSELAIAISQIDFDQPSDALQLPTLTTLNNPQYFRSQDVSLMYYVVQQIRQLQVEAPIRDALLLGVAAAIDDVGHLRKDGRALRYKEKIERPTASKAIKAKWDRILEDLGKVQYSASFNVYRGSAIDLTNIADDETYDLALYSPPYLNNFDYSEIYKLELWMLEYISTVEAWRELRKSTLRSHPSITFEKKSVFDSVGELSEINAILKQMSAADNLSGGGIGKVIVGYFEDMYLAFREQWRVLKPGGFLMYVVANSRHKYLPIATDVILGEIAQKIGFIPLDLIVLKHRNGRTRQKTFLRESAVILQKP